MSEVASTYYDGVVTVQVARKSKRTLSSVIQLSPGPVDTLALVQTTEEMMAELTNMLELNRFAQPPAPDDEPSPGVYQTSSAELFDSEMMGADARKALEAAWQQPAASSPSPIMAGIQREVLRDSPPHVSHTTTPQKQSIVPVTQAANSTSIYGAENIHENGQMASSDLFPESPPDSKAPFSATRHTPGAQRSAGPPATSNIVGLSGTGPSVAETIMSPEDEKAKRAAEWRSQYLHAADSTTSAPLSSTPRPAPPPPSHYKATAEESDVLKRCQVPRFCHTPPFQPSILL